MRRVILAAVTTIVSMILLLSFKTHALPTTLAPQPAAIGDPGTTTPPATAPTTTASTAVAGASPAAAAVTTTTTVAPATTGTQTVTGNAAPTRYGPVQVQVTLTNGRITAVEAVEYPTARSRDIQINNRAIPQLNAEALAAQSAHIHTISGATYTSNGYATSLQSALDKAGVA